MKTLITKLKTSLILASCLGSLAVWAKPVAQIQEVNGLAFVITPTGHTKKIKPLDIIDEQSEVLVEEGTQVSFNDYYNATYYLTGGSHVKFLDRSLQLKKGKTWVKSMSKLPLTMTTANGVAHFNQGQFIATFDLVHGRSQFLVVQGDVEVSNILDQELRYSVAQGHFTVIDPQIADGLPRSPTKVGMASLTAALEEFRMQNAAPLMIQKKSRGIASVDTSAPAKKGEIIFMMSSQLPKAVAKKTSQRSPASVKPEKKTTWSEAPISYYGIKNEEFSNRFPASIRPASSIQVAPTIKKAPEKGPTYSNDLENLLQELKSF